MILYESDIEEVFCCLSNKKKVAELMLHPECELDAEKKLFFSSMFLATTQVQEEFAKILKKIKPQIAEGSEEKSFSSEGLPIEEQLLLQTIVGVVQEESKRSGSTSYFIH